MYNQTIALQPTQKSTQPSIPPEYVNRVLVCLAGVMAGSVHLCRMAGGNAV